MESYHEFASEKLPITEVTKILLLKLVLNYKKHVQLKLSEMRLSFNFSASTVLMPHTSKTVLRA